MYEELVKKIRALTAQETRIGLKTQAESADAIEELQRQIDGWIEQERNALLKSIPKWIPVTERLPEEDCHVLAYYGFNHGDGHLGRMFIQVLDYFARDPRPHFQHEGLNGMTVTHWMRLPEPPKEETE